EILLKLFHFGIVGVDLVRHGLVGSLLASAARIAARVATIGAPRVAARAATFAAAALAAAEIAALAGRDRGRLCLIQLDESFQLLRRESLNVDADLTSVLECERRFSLFSQLLLPEFFVPAMASRFNHFTAFSP